MFATKKTPTVIEYAYEKRNVVINVFCKRDPRLTKSSLSESQGSILKHSERHSYHYVSFVVQKTYKNYTNKRGAIYNKLRDAHNMEKPAWPKSFGFP